MNLLGILGIVETLAPSVEKLMVAAEGLFTKGSNKKQFVTDGLTAIVQGGEAVSKGGQAHTMDELNQALPVLSGLIDSTVAAAKAAGAPAAGNASPAN